MDSLLTFFYHDVKHISVLLPKLFPDQFENTNHITHISLGILQAHIYNAAIIRNPIKFGVDLYPALPKFLPDIPWKNKIKYYLLTNSALQKILEGKLQPNEDNYIQ